MRHLAAYLLLTVGGNTKPTIEDVSNVLAQAGIETDSERLAALFAELQGKDINELIALGKEKLMVGGAMAASSSAPAAASAEGEADNIFTYLIIVPLTPYLMNEHIAFFLPRSCCPCR